jgi:hypothetical protein
MSGKDIITYLTAAGIVFALYMQIRQVWREHNKEKQYIEDALDKRPEVREQLQVGNFKGAIEALNAVNAGQAKYIQTLEERLTTVEARADRCEIRADAAEEFAKKAEARAEEARRKEIALEARVARLEQQLRDQGLTPVC